MKTTKHYPVAPYELTLTVTQKDVDGDDCPIGAAFGRYFGPKYYVVVDCDRAWVWRNNQPYNNRVEVTFFVPTEAGQFIVARDEGEQVTPQTFTFPVIDN